VCSSDLVACKVVPQQAVLAHQVKVIMAVLTDHLPEVAVAVVLVLLVKQAI
jgi:hypothetical protein